MLERIRENSPISASICLARAWQGPRQSQGTFTQSKMTNQDAGNPSVFGSEPRAPGGLHGVLRRPRLFSVKVWGSEEPGAWAEEGAGFGDLSKGHLRACCSCRSPRAVPRVLTGQPQARPSRRAASCLSGHSPPASRDTLRDTLPCEARRVHTGQGWGSQVRICPYVSLPLPGHTKTLAPPSPPHPFLSSFGPLH